MLKKVLYITHTGQMGGAEIVMLNLIRSLDRNRFEPVVAVATDGALVSILRAAGIETHVIPLDENLRGVRKDTLGIGSLAKVRQFIDLAVYVGKLCGFMRKLGVDVVHANSLKAGFYGSLAARFAGKPVIWHVHDHVSAPYLPNSVGSLFRRLISALPNVSLAVSDSVRDRLGAPANARVVRNGVNLPAVVVEPSGPPIIGIVGRVAPWKGQHVFLNAAEKVFRRCGSARFWIVGEPLFGEEAYYRDIKQQVRTLGITSQVDFMGFRDDIPKLLSQMTVVVHASVMDEPFGQVVVEAMAASRPVVATHGGAIPEIVEDGKSGLLVPMDDAPSMANAISRLLDDPELADRLAKAGRDRAVKEFGIDRTVRAVEGIYTELLTPTGPPQIARPRVRPGQHSVFEKGGSL